MTQIPRAAWKATLIVACGIALFSPALFMGDSQLAVANTLLLTLIPVLGYNLLFGNAGQFSLGNAAFLGIGAFATFAVDRDGMPFLAAILIGGLASAFAGFLVGLPSLRLASHYLIFGTLALHFIVAYVLQVIQGNNVAGYIPHSPDVFGVHLGFSESRWFVFLMAFAIVGTWIVHNLVTSRIGRAWTLIKEHPSAAASIGVEVVRWRLSAFVISSFYIGVAGALSAYYLQNINYSTYADINLAVVYVLIVLFGGVGSVFGSVVGSAAYVLLPYLTQWIVQYLPGGFSASRGNLSSVLSLMLFGVLVLGILLFEPAGVVGAVRKLQRVLMRIWARRHSGASGETLLEVIPPAHMLSAHKTGAADTVLELDGVSVRYGDAAVALRDIRLKVAEGRVIALLGPNGAGKTTLLKSVMGFPPADGAVVTARQIAFRGKDIRNYDGARLAKLGIRFVPERDKVFRGLSVGQHLRMDLPRSRSQRDQALEDVLEIFPALRNVPWGSAAGALSGGERQMLALASALTGNVDLLILDEPSLGLAPIAVGQLIQAIEQLRARRSVTILLADQNVRMARELADEIYVLTQGTLVDWRPSGEWDQLKLASAYLAE